MNLQEFLVQNCPQSAIYIPNFITSEEEAFILHNIAKTPKPKWTQLLHRRLINYGGIPHSKGMIAEEIPNWLQTYINKVNNLNIFQTKLANHVLVNEYQPGSGIMPHTDGPLFLPIITTISCGSHGVLELQQSKIDNFSSADKFKLLLESRSLLILKDNLYSDYLHSISDIEEDIIDESISNLNKCGEIYEIDEQIKRSTRISLTIRHVPNATKMKLKWLNV